MEITRDDFESQRQRRFGNANPERMQLAFWEWMIRGDDEPPPEDAPLMERLGMITREGKLKSSYGPYRARDLFNVPLNRDDGPIWTFDRMGETRTPHPDGRMICVGGEHEDSYDPDFCIYNDVIILDLDGSIEIYGYPKDVFPPTDFHTATLLGDRVIIIGRLGYHGERQAGVTPVFALDLASYRIEALTSDGEVPGWIFHHEAELGPDGITVRGGEVYVEKDGETRTQRNFDDFAYDPSSGRWTRVTDRKWREFSIRDREGKSFMMGPPIQGCGGAELDSGEIDDLFVYVMPEALLPRTIAYETVWSDEPSPEDRIFVEDIPVLIKLAPFSIEIVIEGEMDKETADALAEDIREGVEADTGRTCVVEAYD